MSNFILIIFAFIRRDIFIMSKNNFNRSFAIILGINNYENGIPELETAVPDALKLAQIIQEQHTHLNPQYRAQNKYEVQRLLNQSVTLTNLKQLIEDFKKGQIFIDKEKITVNNDDRVLFYFAGHGIALEALDNQDGPVGYLIPQDAKLGDSNTYLPMQELHDALNALPCRHMLAILDCCFAGAFRWASLKRDIVPKVTVYKERYDRFVSDQAWQVITSAADDQKALDSLGLRGKVKDGNEVHSPFAKALFDALGGADEGTDWNKDGIITATKLYSYLRDRVEIDTGNQYKRQTPGLCQLKKHDKGEFIFLLPNFDRDKLANAPPLNVENNPYRGLQSYDEKDSRLFFGRENLIKHLYQRVVANKQALTVVLGASGTGKSSLMKAGLLPLLRQNSEYQFQILDPMRPGESPLKALAQVWLPANTMTADELAKDEQGLANIVECWRKTHPKTKLLLPVDQFEELITLCKSDSEREQFQKLILNAITKYPNKIHVVITVRLDFEAQFQNSVLKDFWNDDTRFVVLPMTQNEFRSCIEKPASEKVVYFDPPSLVDELINEVVQMPGGLPLLSFTLSELYLKYLGDRTRDNRALTKKDYEELGKVVGSLTKRANQEYDQLVKQDAAYKDTICRVLLRMISLQGSELARRQVPKSELEYPDQKEKERVQTVIKHFSEARLIVEGSNSQGEPYVEPAHDALVQGWDKLLNWKQKEEGNLILQRRLTPAAEDWNNIKNQEIQPNSLVKIWNKGEFFLIRKLQTWQRNWQYKKQEKTNISKVSIDYLWDDDPRIEQLNQVLDSNDNWLNWIEDNFVRQSVLQRSKNIYRLFVFVTGVILTLSSLTIWALISQRDAQIDQIRAFDQTSEAEWRSNQDLEAAINALRAGKAFDKLLPFGLFKPDAELAQVRGTLQKVGYTQRVKEYNSLEENSGDLLSVVFSPDGQTIAVASNNTVTIWSFEGIKLQTLTGHNAGVTSVAFSPDGQTIATASDDRMVKLWKRNSTSQFETQPNQTLIGHNAGVTSVAFSPDGQTIATASDDRTVKLWRRNSTGQFNSQPDKILTGHNSDLAPGNLNVNSLTQCQFSQAFNIL